MRREPHADVIAFYGETFDGIGCNVVRVCRLIDSDLKALAQALVVQTRGAIHHKMACYPQRSEHGLFVAFEAKHRVNGGSSP